MPRPLFTPGKDPVPIVQEAGWAPGPVSTGAENLAPTRIRSPDHPARSQSLYRLHYPAPRACVAGEKSLAYAKIQIPKHQPVACKQLKIPRLETSHPNLSCERKFVFLFCCCCCCCWVPKISTLLCGVISQNTSFCANNKVSLLISHSWYCCGFCILLIIISMNRSI